MTDKRIAIIGNAGGGKSTLARLMVRSRDIPLTEIDKLLWKENWREASDEEFHGEHTPLIAGERWLLEGLGKLDSIRPRLLRATWVILIDMVLWQQFWLAAERQIAWAEGCLKYPPAGNHDMITTRDMFVTLWDTEHEWMPTVRANVDEAEQAGIKVTRIVSLGELTDFMDTQRAMAKP
ncbi:MAG: adenylate kinase [Rhodospirillaceae bacterium]|jgi:hypothetical protein|nr:adenylate kinase [Rhodospirillaceae bacterium]MBT6205127.1 adenylate kinase [Rhodospirillaceae bacterium]MBT6512390.1 adenylate kinase [Rhodospirillaceae bacterium]MBT7614660.1 adenylate kinase [Rhodospirillaceae bacterium]MBT7646541.1 adenylate kinase [Rhodospirillaceae bacterium]